MNRAKCSLWIDAKPSFGGNYIKSKWYIEFYPETPRALTVTWCYFTPDKRLLYRCDHIVVNVNKKMVSVNVPVP